jgi:hypothetical protein
VLYTSLRQMSGATERDREHRTAKQQQDFRRMLRDVARDNFVDLRRARARQRR